MLGDVNGRNGFKLAVSGSIRCGCWICLQVSSWWENKTADWSIIKRSSGYFRYSQMLIVHYLCTLAAIDKCCLLGFDRVLSFILFFNPLAWPSKWKENKNFKAYLQFWRSDTIHYASVYIELFFLSYLNTIFRIFVTKGMEENVCKRRSGFHAGAHCMLNEEFGDSDVWLISILFFPPQSWTRNGFYLCLLSGSL